MSIVEKAAERLRTKDSRPRARQQPIVRDEPENDNEPLQERQAHTQPRAAQPSSQPAERVEPPRSNGNAQRRPQSTEGIRFDHRALRRIGMLPPESMMQKVAREYQRIKRPLLAEMAEDNGTVAAYANRLMVTSANPGEGKTFTSFNLAFSLANEFDYSVLLVDGDVPKPGVTRSLGLQQRLGLMDVLTDFDMSPEDAIVPTDVANLSVMPAGRSTEQAAERLSSRRMEWLVGELSADPSRIVLFDSAPLLATAESQALALHMGQILLIVKAGATERKALDAALTLISQPNLSVNLILNQSRSGLGEEYAGYYGVYRGASDGVS